MLEETIAEVAVINERETLLKENTDNYLWYSDATQELCQSLIDELQSMCNVGIKLIDNYTRIQKSKFTEEGVGREDHH